MSKVENETIYGKSPKEERRHGILLTEKQFQDFRYGDFKLAVAETVINYLEPIAEKFEEISDSVVDSAVENNLKLAKVSAQLTISEIETALGID